MYFTSLKQDGQVLSITGIAQTQERVSEFLRNTAYNSEWLVSPELIESRASLVAGATGTRSGCSSSPSECRSSGRWTRLWRPRRPPVRPPVPPPRRRPETIMATKSKAINVDLNSCSRVRSRSSAA